MKILVTGGAGFIGSHIVEKYHKLGHVVMVIDDLSTGHAKNLPPGIPLLKLSIQDRDLDRIVGDFRPDIVNHHAAQIEIPKSVADPVLDAHINIVGSLNLLEVCRKHDIKKIIFASTGGAIYGEQRHYPADESHPTEPRSPYGIAKLTVEKYLHYYQWTYGLPFVALRYGNIYGPRQNSRTEAGVIAIFIEKLLRHEPITVFGDGRQTRDYVCVDDVVDCNIAALNPGINGVFNVGTGKETSINNLAKMLTELCRSPTHIRQAPARPGELLRGCLKPGKLQQASPIPLSEGLKKTVDWFRHKLELA